MKTVLTPVEWAKLSKAQRYSKIMQLIESCTKDEAIGPLYSIVDNYYDKVSHEVEMYFTTYNN